ncbi:hypothetical protein ACFQ1L_39190 [Phytohabitans flavus]|nr:hypothetical protein [Phytohabitans flavus]
MGSRTVIAMVGWLVAAAAATVVGLGAVRVIGEGITGTAATTLTQEEVAEALASPIPSPSAAATASLRPSPAPTTSGPPPTPLRPAGSTITAHCEGGQVELDGVTAPLGYQIVEYDRGLTDEAEVRFERGGKGHGNGRLEVHVTCVDGRPRATVDD